MSAVITFVSTVAHKIKPLPAIDIDYFWPGAVTDSGIVVAAKLGQKGAARLLVSASSDLSFPIRGQWVQSDQDGYVKLSVDSLSASTKYYFRVQGGGKVDINTGEFRTLPVRHASFKVVTASCAYTGSNHLVFELIKRHHADALMFIHTGDIHYRDIAVNDPQLFKNAYRAVFQSTRQSLLYRSMPLIYMWDDHDFGPDNSNANSPSKSASMHAYRTCVPHYPLLYGNSAETDAVGQTFAIGRVRFIILDVRSHKLAGTTMLGAKQKQWLKDTLLLTTEPVIGIMTGVPWISSVVSDDWAGNASERRELADFFVENGLNDRVFIWAGDMHGIAADDGTNSQYATGGSAVHGAGPPVFQFAALDQNGSVKGGPYSEGAYPGGGRFGVFEVDDDGSTITVTGIGYRVEGDGLVEVLRLSKQYGNL